ncbi:hypothetical protein [Novosphingobium sp. JCM 18896]|uniref:hypothetical protein n=1 Tax=Novosphingobium sp. JCM 18896 TaxID=2989731 RepID=UPI00222210FB|nr:hypothetical protein [Novosphingobium sp. JCM 18896]MCW1432197.1 hypothetical protein [Novosphingobium sp. JCM 18896]
MQKASAHSGEGIGYVVIALAVLVGPPITVLLPRLPGLLVLLALAICAGALLSGLGRREILVEFIGKAGLFAALPGLLVLLPRVDGAALLASLGPAFGRGARTLLSADAVTGLLLLAGVRCAALLALARLLALAHLLTFVLAVGIVLLVLPLLRLAVLLVLVGHVTLRGCRVMQLLLKRSQGDGYPGLSRILARRDAAFNGTPRRVDQFGQERRILRMSTCR